ncbi:MAG: hypothetical protein O9333_11140 [Beijerinckiaceae bacterium]|nr:hypothetical protein [Beijerinckiaceae bacterium]
MANARTLEQKISDSGPNNQRIDPHVLTPVRQALEKEGLVERTAKGGNTWYFLGNTPQDLIQPRLDEQFAIFSEYSKNRLRERLGQTLEIATYRALMQLDGLEFYGRFRDLDEHDDSTLYAKEEPPQHVGNRALPGQLRLDFMARHPDAGILGIECKNVREWMYPDREEIIELAFKATTLNVVPVLIARRIPFVTFKVLSACGVIIHQTYNQLLPVADEAIAAQMRDKNLLGYHDIRTGNVPDKRMVKFITADLMKVAPASREKFEAFSDLLGAFGRQEMKYHEFAARVRRRLKGTKEDNDWPEEHPSEEG